MYKFDLNAEKWVDAIICWALWMPPTNKNLHIHEYSWSLLIDGLQVTQQFEIMYDSSKQINEFICFHLHPELPYSISFPSINDNFDGWANCMRNKTCLQNAAKRIMLSYRTVVFKSGHVKKAENINFSTDVVRIFFDLKYIPRKIDIRIDGPIFKT